ncbi:hypothetical protein ACN9MU_21080 [Pseudoduganella sp. R-32]|uniref:hypothetical protein n=1 Tax=unclassified Pseudoduganella TaxID=2637179 RepID=UPI003CFA892F
MSEAIKLDITPRLAQQRACIARLMDDHPCTFAAPQDGGRWSEFIQHGTVAQGADRHTADKALGMLSSTIRTAQLSLNVQTSLVDMLARARELEIADFPADPAAMAQAGPNADQEEATAYGQAITVYKQCVLEGLMERQDLLRFLAEAFDELPATTPLSRALIETAKMLVMIDLEELLPEQELLEAPR